MKKGSLPRMERSTITAATDATTVDPSKRSFMSPMISSSANKTAATGVLKAPRAPRRPPTGTSALRGRARGAATPNSGGQARPDLHGRPFAAHRVAEPMHSTPVMNFPKAMRPGMWPCSR